jgi:hypothetical protein
MRSKTRRHAATRCEPVVEKQIPHCWGLSHRMPAKGDDDFSEAFAILSIWTGVRRAIHESRWMANVCQRGRTAATVVLTTTPAPAQSSTEAKCADNG